MAAIGVCLRRTAVVNRGLGSRRTTKHWRPITAAQALILRPTGNGDTEHLGGQQAPLAGPFLLKNGQHVVGRTVESDVSIPIPTVSSRHAVLLVDDDDAQLTDLQSTNGTTVDGVELEPMQPCSLVNGSDIVFGDPALARFTVEFTNVSGEPSSGPVRRRVDDTNPPEFEAWPANGDDDDWQARWPTDQQEIHYAIAPAYESGFDDGNTMSSSNLSAEALAVVDSTSEEEEETKPVQSSKAAHSPGGSGSRGEESREAGSDSEEPRGWAAAAGMTAAAVVTSLPDTQESSGSHGSGTSYTSSGSHNSSHSSSHISSSRTYDEPSYTAPSYSSSYSSSHAHDSYSSGGGSDYSGGGDSGGGDSGGSDD